MSDKLLWGQLIEGNKKALEQIYRSHGDALYNYGRRITTDADLVEDAIHDLFVYIWDKRRSLGSTNNILPYLLISLKRDLIKRINKNIKKPIVKIEEQDYKIADEDKSVEASWISTEELKSNNHKLDQSLQTLSKRQKEAIYLKFHQNLSLNEIAEALNISNQSVRNLLFQALQKLRKNFGWMPPIIYLLFFEYKIMIEVLLRQIA